MIFSEYLQCDLRKMIEEEEKMMLVFMEIEKELIMIVINEETEVNR